MAWAVLGVVVLALLLTGLFLGLRDIPPTGRSALGEPGGKSQMLERIWKRIDEQARRRRKSGR